MIQKIFTSFAIVSCIVACDEQTHDIQYYIDHPKERKEKLAECWNNPGEKADTPNCKNAKKAECHNMFGTK